MYLEYFHLHDKPYGNTPDPRFLYPSKQYEEALARLLYTAEERELALLTGEIGSGKTTLSRTLIDSLDERFVPILIINPRLSPSQFLMLLVKKWGKEPRYFKCDIIDQLHDSLFEEYEKGKTPVLIVDEAQLIPSKSVFDEIRLLTNFQLDNSNLLSIILIGQPELLRRLHKKRYDALAQRITMRFHLEPLQKEDVGLYLEHRWRVAGSDLHCPFDHKAKDLIAQYSGGIPRLINSIATNCLIQALAEGSRKIGTRFVIDAAKELHLAA
jgi:type II secretory pathway predicted ATPase ExeA